MSAASPCRAALLRLLGNERGENAYGEQADHNPQADHGRNMDDARHVKKHLGADVGENDDDGLFQVAQVALGGRKQEIELAHAENGENVAGVYE